MVKIKIACVDDHQLFLDGVTTAMKKTGWIEVIFTALNGKMLFDKLETELSPDAILLDLHMPIMDGYETMLHLRNFYPQIKVIILSMNNDPGIMCRLKDLR